MKSDRDNLLLQYREYCYFYGLQLLLIGVNLDKIKTFQDKLWTFGEWYKKITGDDIKEEELLLIKDCKFMIINTPTPIVD
jgi:hypothetical protein